MTTKKTITSRELSRKLARTKQAARREPVFITEHGDPSHVLMSIEEYWRLTGTSIADLLRMNEDGIEFEPGRLSDEFLEPPDFD